MKNLHAWKNRIGSKDPNGSNHLNGSKRRHGSEERNTSEDRYRPRNLNGWKNLRVVRAPGVLRRPLPVSLGVALLVALTVVLAVELGGAEYESRVGLLAVATDPGESAQAGFGEVVALSLPALVEVARTPTVLRATADELGTTTDDLARRVSVELVPASGLARLSVRASTADQAAQAATRIAQTVVDADLLSPVARLRLLDRPETTQVAPDRPLGFGLALVAGIVAGLAAFAVGHLRRTRSRDDVRAALTAGGVRRPVAVLPDDDPDLARRLAVLCEASARPARVVAVVPELTDRAEGLAAELPDKTGEPADGDAVIVLAPAAGRPEELAAVVGALPTTATVVAVVTC
jgi:capsular polysaccharide biosynthesis protein